MQIRNVKIKLYLLGLLFAVSCPALSHAEPVRMSIQPNGQGSFVMTGENVIGVQTLDVDIDYDASMLAHPNVMTNGGDVKQIKDDVPGKLVLSIFRPIADPLLQIFVYFEEARAENTTRGIYHVSAVVKSTAVWPTEKDADSPQAGIADEPTDPTADASSLPQTEKTVPPGVIVKANPSVAPERPRASDTPVVIAKAASLTNSGMKDQAEKITVLTREGKSVLQRFKKYKGKEELSSFAALFGRSDGNAIVQEPAIAISDGKTPVTIRIAVKSDPDHPTGLALSDATLLSKEAREKDILITVLPSEGTWDARLVIVAGGSILDYPIVVAPPIDLIGAVNENNFLEALQVYINSRSSVFQGENKRYLAEYILTANYLAALDRRTQSFIQ